MKNIKGKVAGFSRENDVVLTKPPSQCRKGSGKTCFVKTVSFPLSLDYIQCSGL